MSVHELCMLGRHPPARTKMATIQKNNRAASLLAAITETDHLSLERLALLAGISLADLRACRDRKMLLPAEVQVRLARVISDRIPRLASPAHRLAEQATAAVAMNQGSTTLHLTAPAKWR